MTNATESTSFAYQYNQTVGYLNDLIRDQAITLLSLTCVNCVTELSFILHTPDENLKGSRTFNERTEFASKDDLLDELWMTRGMVSA